MARTAIQTFLYGHRREDSAAAAWPGVELIGRVMLSAIFILSGLAKFLDWSGTAEHMTAQGLEPVNLLLPLAAVVEIVGGLAVLTGTFARIGAFALILFLIPTTFAFHDFWRFEGAARTAQMANFFKNLGLMGGLLLVLSHGPGPWSVDNRAERRAFTR